MAAEEHSPLEQFEIHPILPINIGGLDVSFTNSALWMVIAAGLVYAPGDVRRAPSQHGARPAAVPGRAELRVHRRHGRQHGRQGRRQVFPVLLHAVHVHPVRQRARHDPGQLHLHQPHHRHLLDRDLRGHRGDADRHHPSRLALLQPVHARRLPDLRHAAARADRDPVLRDAADQPVAAAARST